MTAKFAPIVPSGTTMTFIRPSVPIPASPAPAPLSRFAGEPVRWVHVGSGVAISAFARSAASVFAKASGDTTSGNPSNPTGPWVIIELSPLPGFAPAVFRQLGGGMPIQYIVLPLSSAPSGIDQLMFDAGETVCTTTGDAWFGMVFQDRVVRDPAAWSAQIGAALTTTSTDPGQWLTFATSLAALAPSTVYLLDHVGHPLTAGQVTVDTGSGPHTITLTKAFDGDSGQVLPSGGRATVSFASAGFPLVSSAETPGGAVDASYQMAPNERHLQLFDADRWFGVPAAEVAGVRRFCPNSHVEAIPDGTPYFTQLIADLRAARHGGAAHFAGWAFTKGGVADPTKPWDLIPWQDDTQLIPLMKELVNDGCQLRFLVNQLIQLETDPLDDDKFAVELMVLFYMTLLGAKPFNVLTTDLSGLGILLAGIGIAGLLLTSEFTTDLARLYAEPSWETFPDLAALGSGVAGWAKYPPTVSDNPLAHGPLVLPGGVTVDDIIRFGVFHQKAVAIRFPDGSYTSYLGGIDLNSDRADTPLHRSTFPYHDVHARVLGPAAQDVITTIDQRLPLAGLAAAFHPPGTGSTPAIPDIPPEQGQHLAQIARTYFAPKIGSGTAPFTFAPQGETTIHDTICAAIDQATDFIYIEDQYFTPDKAYVQKLLAAADRDVRMLMVVVGMDNGQIFGDTRLSEIVAALSARWGTRFRCGTPFRRYLNPTPASTVNLGRCLLRTAIDSFKVQITIGPISRVPKAPFFCFVEGELMLATHESPPDDTAHDGRTFWVERATDGADPRWNPNVVDHAAGVPVLCVRVPSVYVHAKCMVIDDIFMTVGSANINRRGHFHDGELNVFAVPQRLKNDPTNPARNMRCRLWAEHLGLSPEMGLSLLADPLSALPYFERAWYVGSAFQAFTFNGSSSLTDVNFGTGILSLAVGTGLEAYKSVLWNTAVDPTTGSDPNATVPGPDYP